MRHRFGLLLIAWLAGLSSPQSGLEAGEYVLVGSYGNKLYLIDPIALRVTDTYEIPGPGPAPTEIVPSPDGRVAYALTDQWQSVSGINLDSGKQVFRADLSSGNVRAHSLFGLDVSPDGKWLYVVEQRYRALPDRYEVMDPVIAVYPTNGGSAARPARLIPIPRQIQHLAVSHNGRTLFAQGIDLYAIDVASGAIRRTYPIANWRRPGYGPADSIAWLGEQLNGSGIYAIPFYAERRETGASGKPRLNMRGRPGDDATPHTVGAPAPDLGVLTANLQSGAVSLDLIGNSTEAPDLVSASVDPADPNEVIGLGEELVKIDLRTRRVTSHAATSGIRFYVVAVSRDGKRVYTAGGVCRVGIYKIGDFSEIGLVELPHCATMGQTSLRLVDRPRRTGLGMN